MRLAAAAALCAGLLAAQAAAARAQLPDVEAQFAGRIAAERQRAGLTGLALAPDLVDVARRHSAVMASQNRLYHNPQLGTQVANWLKVGENVGTGATVDNIHAALMASTVHREEILSRSFTEVGVGVVGTPDGALWVTQIFRLPEQAAVAPAPAPAPAPVPTAAPPTTAAPAPVPTTRPAAQAPAPPPTTARAARAARAPATAPAPTAPPSTAPPSTAPPATAPPATAAPAAPPSTARAPSVSLAQVPVSASVALPARSAVTGLGMAAAGLLWLVTVSVMRSVVVSSSRRR